MLWWQLKFGEIPVYVLIGLLARILTIKESMLAIPSYSVVISIIFKILSMGHVLRVILQDRYRGVESCQTLKMERFDQNSYENSEWLKVIYYFRKKLRLRCLTEFGIRLWDIYFEEQN